MKVSKEYYIDLNLNKFDHNGVSRKFGPSVYIGTFSFNGSALVSSVYKALNPDKKKGHKKYFILTKLGSELYISGKSSIVKHRYRKAIKCKSCKDIIFSAHRHHYNECNCKNVAIDGGDSYTKIINPKGCKVVTIDLLKGKKKYL